MKNGTKRVKANTFLNLAKRKKEKSTSSQIIFSKHKQDQTNKYKKAQTKLSWKQDAWKELNTKIYSLYKSVGIRV